MENLRQEKQNLLVGMIEVTQRSGEKILLKFAISIQRISKYEISKLLEQEYKSSLPSIEEIEESIKELDSEK